MYLSLRSLARIRLSLRQQAGSLRGAHNHLLSSLPHNVNTSASSPLTMAFRFVLVLDQAFGVEYFTGSKPISTPFNHPKSTHLIRQYYDLYYHRQYNYNDIGEYELTILPAARWRGTQDSNSLLIYPDQVSISSSSPSTLFPKLLTPIRIEPSQPTSADSNTVINPLPRPAVLINLSPRHPWSRAQRTVHWVEHCAQQHHLDLDILLTMDYTSVLSSEVVFLPTGLRLHNVLSAVEVERAFTQWLGSHSTAK